MFYKNVWQKIRIHLNAPSYTLFVSMITDLTSTVYVPHFIDKQKHGILVVTGSRRRRQNEHLLFSLGTRSNAFLWFCLFTGLQLPTVITIKLHSHSQIHCLVWRKMPAAKMKRKSFQYETHMAFLNDYHSLILGKNKHIWSSY